jgi:hypothetical protein
MSLSTNLSMTALKIALLPFRLLLRLLVILATAVLLGVGSGLGGLGSKRKVKNVKRTDPSGWVVQQR